MISASRIARQASARSQGVGFVASIEAMHALKVAISLALGLGASTAVGPSARADQGADAAAAAAHDNAIKMRRFIVSATRIDKNPWRYASLPGFEVLSRAPAKETSWMLDSLRRGLWLQNDLMPKDWVPQSPVPYTVIIDNTDFSTVPIGQIHSQPIMLHAPEDALAWGRWSGGALVWADHIEACDSDTFAFDSNVFGVDMKTISYASISLERLGRCAPPLPRWLIAGLIGQNSGVFREGFVPFISKGMFGPGWIHRAVGPGTLWVSLDETQRLMDRLEDDKMQGRSTVIGIPSLSELFGEAPVPEERLAVWESEAALFVQWGLMGPGSEDPDLSRAFLELVRRARREPVTEKVFTDCFGFGYAAMEGRLVSFLKAVLARPNSIDLDMPSGFPAPNLKAATPDQIGRILGDWLRMQGDSFRQRDPEMSRESFYFAGRMLERAYRQDNGLSPDVAPPNEGRQTGTSSRAATLESAASTEPLVVTADRIHDPGLLAVYGLYEHDTGDDGRARAFLEAAVKAKVARPRAYAVLARLRYSEAIGKPLGSAGKLSAQQAAAILGPVQTSLQHAPGSDAYRLIVETLERCEARPAERDIEEIVGGAALFPRDIGLAYRSAVVCAHSGYAAQAADLIEKGLVFTSPGSDRDHMEQLHASLLVAPVPGTR